MTETSVRDAAQWEAYCAAVRAGENIADYINATDDYAKIDKSQGSRAYNRAKKAMEILGYFKDEKWREKQFGNMGAKIKVEFFAILRSVNEEHMHHVKLSFVNELPRKFKRLPRGGVLLDGVSPIQGNADSHPAAKRQKVTESSAITSQLLSISELATASDVVKEETVKSIRASRLADAMQQPSFSSIPQSDQEAIRDEWVSLLH